MLPFDMMELGQLGIRTSSDLCTRQYFSYVRRGDGWFYPSQAKEIPYNVHLQKQEKPCES